MPFLCPVCDFPYFNVFDVLARIKDEALLVELGCDLAGHVAHLTLDPERTEKILEMARLRDDRVSHAASEANWARIDEKGGGINVAGEAVADAARAAASASGALGWAGANVAKSVASAASEARSAVKHEDLDAEITWQLERVTSRVCNCPRPFAAGATDDRDRISLLAG